MSETPKELDPLCRREEYDLHKDQSVVREDGHELVELFRLQPDSACQLIVLQTGSFLYSEQRQR